MSEIMIKSEKPAIPVLLPSLHVRHSVKPWRFALALILAPIIVAILFFWAYFIPVAAVVFGGIPYLLFGGPVFWHLIHRGKKGKWPFALGGFVANAAFCILGVIWIFGAALLNGRVPVSFHDFEAFLILYAGFGSVHAIAWSIAFAILYFED